MKIKNVSSLVGPLSLGLFSLSTLEGQSASVFAQAFTGEGNQMNSWIIGPVDTTTTPFQVVRGDGSSQHELGDSGGNGTLEFSGTATASAGYSTLRAAASGSLTNSYYDKNYDFDSASGVPTAFYAQGTAEFAQTLAYGGTANSYTSTYLLHLSGTISGSGRGAVIVELTHAMAPPQSWVYVMEGDFDLNIRSQAYVHGQFAQEFKLRINTLYSFDTDFLQDGFDYSGAADFGSTLQVVGIDLRDENGVLQDQGTITSDSGAMFTIIAVPEPASALLTLSGLAFLAFVRSRRLP